MSKYYINKPRLINKYFVFKVGNNKVVASFKTIAEAENFIKLIEK